MAPGGAARQFEAAQTTAANIHSVPFSVPLKIPLPRVSKYLGSPSRGLKLL